MAKNSGVINGIYKDLMDLVTKYNDSECDSDCNNCPLKEKITADEELKGISITIDLCMLMVAIYEGKIKQQTA